MPKQKNPDQMIERLGRVGRYEVKKGADGQATQGLFSGHGALFADVHPTSSWQLMYDGEWNDQIAPGAFVDSLAAHKARGTMPAMCLNHNWGDLPIGSWLSAGEDAEGLALDGQLATKTQVASDVYELMKLGSLTGLSIGFLVTKSELDEKQKLRTITSVDLLEVSVVTIPAIAGARVEDVKSRNPRNIRHLEEILRDAGLSHSEAKALLADGFKGLVPPRDVDGGLLQSLRALTNTIRG